MVYRRILLSEIFDVSVNKVLSRTIFTFAPPSMRKVIDVLSLFLRAFEALYASSFFSRKNRFEIALKIDMKKIDFYFFSLKRDPLKKSRMSLSFSRSTPI